MSRQENLYVKDPQGYPSQYPPQEEFFPDQGYFQGQYPAGSNVIVTQPQPSNLSVTKPRDYLWFSIFVCFCCFLPIGIVAIIYSCESRDAFAAGNVISAQDKGKTARSLNIVGMTVGLICIIIGIIRAVIILKSENLL